MMNLVLDPSSEEAVVDSFDTFKADLIRAAREGMQEAMEALGWAAADHLFGDPVQSRSGALLGTLTGSAKAYVSGEVVRGTVSTSPGGKPVGLWLEFGTHVRAVLGKLFAFDGDEGAVFARGHKAFEVKGKDFLNRTVDAQQSTIMQTIAARIGASANVSA